MIQDVVECLACPHCGDGLVLGPGGTVLRCTGGRHAFDLARQGYVSLLAGDAQTGTADTAEMVAARDAFLTAGHYAPVARALADAAGACGAGEGCVLDLGAGTGYYLSTVLDALPGAAGIALDLSKYALRRAARAHARAGAVVADAWRRLPVRSGASELVLNVFAPRRGEEIRRVLRPGGSLLVVTPTSDHLRELVDSLGLLAVDSRKSERLDATLGPHLTRVGVERVEFGMSLDHAAVETVVRMGPSAWHTSPEALRARVAELPASVRATASVDLTRYQRPLS